MNAADRPLPPSNTELEPLIVEPAPPPPPTWANVIPATFNDLIAGICGITVTGAVIYLAVNGGELAQIAAQTLFTGFVAWLTWTTRGRIEAARNAPKPLEPAEPPAR